jgi:predicted glutamine amidotransferase
MCRLFGFRSSLPARVHRSLVTEKNSLLAQSREHKDGWGIAYYPDDGQPHVSRGLGPAHCDPEFDRISGLLSSHAVLAHVRLASVGGVHLANAHPFIFGRWAFAHNGTLSEFAHHQRALEALVDSDLLAHCRGETDSERCFYLFLTHLRRIQKDPAARADDVAMALAQTVRQVSELTDASSEKPSSMNFLVTDGDIMVATRRHRSLYFSECKRRQPTSHVPLDGTRLVQLVIASEELSGEDHWHEVPEGGLVGVDEALTLRFWTVQQAAH